ncbi:hypothetical protein LPUS_00568 [Lasallia pustulata]|uniref:Transmembrane protein n=1 Tax=Lasallia pustulata TaxID=136370 RepID=A0A1W5CZJ1_9LECA|nr:hypothetical protein LPUS_00568 [Lasallia pustulata]
MGTSNTRRRLQCSSFKPLFPFSLLLLSTLARATTAQSLFFGNGQSADPTSASSGSPTSTISSSATASSTGVPAPTGYGAPSTNLQQGRNTGILNYYFLLLAIFIVVIALGYCILIRRRKRKVARSRSTGQNALAQDLEGWAGTRRWGHNRWRSSGVHEPRAEEGLDDRGEAPPPYMPGEPSPVHLDAGNSSSGYNAPIPLQTMERDAAKPPDYV